VWPLYTVTARTVAYSMNRIKILQVGVISGLVLTTGVQVWKPSDDPHGHHETSGGPENQIGRGANSVEVTGNAVQYLSDIPTSFPSGS
jgi:hypothetical protein